MSILNHFSAQSVTFDESESKVTAKGALLPHDGYTFKYTTKCITTRIIGVLDVFFLFNFRTSYCLIVFDSTIIDGLGEKFECKLMKFWIEEDLPVLSTNIWTDQRRIMELMKEDFQAGYASYILDNVINSNQV